MMVKAINRNDFGYTGFVPSFGIDISSKADIAMP